MKPFPLLNNRSLTVAARMARASERVVLLAAVFLMLFACGCGYHIAGRGELLPKSVKTIAIQPFGNATLRYKLARLLPSDIGRELISRTKYSLIEDTNQADAVLSGSLVNYFAYPSVIDPATSRATTVEVVTITNITLTERSGKVLFTRQGFEVRQHYEITGDPKAYFDESGTAMERISKDVARGVVSAILEAF